VFALLIVVGSFSVGAPRASADVSVIDINPGPDPSNPTAWVQLGPKIYFGADNGADGAELYSYDGQTTSIVKDINPGAAASSPEDLVVIGGKILFTADDGTGRELWRSDGTDAGTQMVEDINPTGKSFPDQLTLRTSKTIYFVADDGTNGVELWKSNGTAKGTKMVEDINPGDADSAPAELTAFKNGLFLFTADNGTNGREMWRTDGTAGGTFMVADLNTTDVGGSIPEEYLWFGGSAVFFSADDGVDHGRELFRTNGKASGTVLVADINPGAADSDPTTIVRIGGSLALAADTASQGREIVRVDVTDTPATFVIDDIASGATGSDPVMVSDGTFAFAVATGAQGRELYKTTETGTVLDEDINPTGDGFPFQVDDEDFAIITSKVLATVLFAADSGDGTELHERDGRSGVVRQVEDVNPGPAGSDPSVEHLLDLPALNIDFDPRLEEPAVVAMDDTSSGTELHILPTLSINNVKAKEGNGREKRFTFTVTLSEARSQTITVHAETEDGRAKEGKDYFFASRTLTFTPGQTVQTFDVYVKSDTNPEADEEFFVNLFDATGPAIVSDGQGFGGVLNDDG
jgi:ELWxxDGT repeat protein